MRNYCERVTLYISVLFSLYLFILYFVLFQFALRFVFVFSSLHMLHDVVVVVVVGQICLIIFTLNVAPSKRECENNFKRETLLSQRCGVGARG